MTTLGDGSEVSRAFGIGFVAGEAYGDITPRMADKLLRDCGVSVCDSTVTACCEGSIDGANGDTFRLHGANQ